MFSAHYNLGLTVIFHFFLYKVSLNETIHIEGPPTLYSVRHTVEKIISNTARGLVKFNLLRKLFWDNVIKVKTNYSIKECGIFSLSKRLISQVSIRFKDYRNSHINQYTKPRWLCNKYNSHHRTDGGTLESEVVVWRRWSCNGGGRTTTSSSQLDNKVPTKVWKKIASSSRMYNDVTKEVNMRRRSLRWWPTTSVRRWTWEGVIRADGQQYQARGENETTSSSRYTNAFTMVMAQLSLFFSPISTRKWVFIWFGYLIVLF